MYTYTLFSHTHTRTPLPRENCTRAETRAGERAEGRSEERRCKDGKSVCALFSFESRVRAQRQDQKREDEQMERVCVLSSLAGVCA